MRFRFIGILGGHIARFQTHEEARAYIHAIPGARGSIVDRVYTPEVGTAGEIEDEECEPFPLVRVRLPHY